MVPVNLNLILMRYWMGCFMVFKLQCLNLVAVLAVSAQARNATKKKHTAWSK